MYSRILGNGVVYHLASSNISLCFTTLNCSNKANGYWKELAICLYFLLLFFLKKKLFKRERTQHETGSDKKAHTPLFFSFIGSESHLNAIVMNSLKREKDPCFVHLQWVLRPALKPNDYLTVLNLKLASISPFPPLSIWWIGLVTAI